MCTEMEDDKHLDARHAIEEAMSELTILVVEPTVRSKVVPQLEHSCATAPSVRKVRSRPLLDLAVCLIMLFLLTVAFVKEHGVRIYL